MLDLKNFTVNNQVSLNLLLTTRNELSEKRQSLINECVKYQKPFDKSYLQNPDYIKIQETLKYDLEVIAHISNCINLYVKYGNISGNNVLDDREQINNILTFEKVSPKTFKKSNHKLGFKIIGNRTTKTLLFKGFDEYEVESFFSINGYTKHKQVEDRFYELARAMYVHASHYSVNDYIRDGYRVVYGYVNENNNFFETGYIS
jgi:hypothetical protein